MAQGPVDVAALRVPQVARAHDSLGRRGETLSPAALRVLAREVILRVSRNGGAVARTGDAPQDAEIERLCDALLSQDDAAASGLVRMARQDGMSADTLYHAYIGEAARRLGLRWERDKATAAEVILAAGRVYAILRELRAIFLGERLVAPPGAEAIFACVPGEVHGLGATIAADTMRRKGWDISLRLGLGHDALVEDIARAHPTMVGLSVSVASLTFATARLIVALRVRCPQVWVLVAGPVVAADPDFARIVDADAGAATMDEAAALLAAHLAELGRISVRKG